MNTMGMIANDVAKTAGQLQWLPQHKKQADSLDKMIRILSHLIYLVTRLMELQELSPEEKLDVYRRIHVIVRNVDPRYIQLIDLLFFPFVNLNVYICFVAE